MWVLKTGEGADPPFSFRILPGSIRTMGRGAVADFMVDAPLVSRVHCRLTAGASELEVADLDSTNGTHVNGKRVKKSMLNDGDGLRIGRVEFTVSRTDSSASPAR